jgi:uncharacterized protein DUF3455
MLKISVRIRPVRQLVPAVTLLALALVAGAQLAPPADVPQPIRTAAGEQLVLKAHASGWQIYLCSAGSDGKSAWTLKAPQAELRDAKGAVIGRHYAGPTWRDDDGSEVTGKALARVESPQPDSIPWLLVSAVSHAGHGVLERVTSIQRIHTKGGQPPPAQQCDAAKQGAEARVPYSADYYFYAPAAS